MAKPELGTKRTCPVTGRKFYDLNKDPVISPYTGEIVPIAVAPPPRVRAESARTPSKVVPIVVAPETADADFVSLEDADAEATGAKVPAMEGAEGEEEDVEVGDGETLDAFIEEEQEGDADVTDIIGDGIEKEEET